MVETKRDLRKMDLCILMVVSKGLGDFVANAVASIKSAGVNTKSIIIFTTRSGREEIAAASAEGAGVEIRLIEDILAAGPGIDHDSYAGFGTAQFGLFTQFKWLAARYLLSQGVKHVVYTDVDIAWRADPLPLLQKIATQFDLALQTEARPIFPPEFCTGFMSFKNSPFCRDFLEFLIKTHATVLRNDPAMHDQDVFNNAIRSNPTTLRFIYPLSEQLFMNGLLTNMIKTGPGDAERLLTGKYRPLVYHANWTLGLENKRTLLKMTGNWHPGAKEPE